MNHQAIPESSERSACIGKYRLVASLGRGGMAEVYLAVVSGPAGFSKLQVLKVLRGHLAPEPEFVGMFLDEARLAARLNHPNVVQTNEVGEENGGYFIAMEYLEGQAFSRITRHAPTGITLRVISDALSGLHYAHELLDYDGSPLSVVHRDVSPHNIFVGYDGQVKLLDFGIAKAATSSSDTMVGMIKGKVSYMSPEQASGTRVDRRSDVFGMGIVLWEAIAGRRLWDGLTDVQIIHALALGNIPRLSDVKPDVDPELADICARALAEVRDLRYGSALELREALVRYLDRLQTRPSQDDVGAFVTKMFAEKREGIRALVEQQLKDLGRGLAAMPIVDVEGNGTRANTSPDRLGSTPVTDSRPARGSAAPTSGPVSAATGGVVASQRPPEDTSVSPMLAGDPTRSRARPFGALALGLAALFGLGLAFRSRTASNDVARLPRLAADPGATRLVASADVAPPTAVPTAAAPRVEMRFAAIPPDASLTLDGRTLPSNPYTALVELDGKPHELRAAATGYIAETRELLFEPHGRVELTLANDPKARGGQGVVKGTKPGSPAGVTTVGAKRAIDKANPWTD